MISETIRKRNTLIRKRNFAFHWFEFCFLQKIFAEDINRRAMEYKISTRKTSVCLECGDKIRYGRTDKKFCCEDCRVRYNNHQARGSKIYRRRIQSTLSSNYAILDALLREGVTSVDIVELVSKGFVIGIMTSYNKVCRHDEYACFDIKYKMTASRVYGITKISLNL